MDEPIEHRYTADDSRPWPVMTAYEPPQKIDRAKVTSLRARITLGFVLCLTTLATVLPGRVAAAETELISKGAVWRYLDDGSDQATAWAAPSFDDSGWATGPAQLGYGDGDEATVVSFGPSSSNKFITTYFRHAFNVASPSAFTGVELRLQRDDGARVYLNGTEIVRSNLPSGLVTYVTPAPSAIGGSSENAFATFPLAPNELDAGTNVLAIEIHQHSGTSSDISLDLELVGLDDQPEVTRGPYLQLGTPNSVVVRWRTNVPTDSRLRFGSAPGALDQIIDDANMTTEHEIKIDGLTPSTQYFYSVGNSAGPLAGGDSDHLFVTSPPAGSTGPTRIWILGDSGTANSDARDVRDAYRAFAGSDPADLWLMLGDNAYPNGTDQEYQAAVFDMYPEELRTRVLWPTLGNHDGQSASSGSLTGPYYDMFTLPAAGEAGGIASGTEAYYSFDYANIHFICLNSYDVDRSVDGAMLTWLEYDLVATTADWIIAFWHHPPYTKGSHDSDIEGRLIDMREYALPILETYGVDLVLAGHSHSYERSILVNGHYDSSGTLNSSMILDGGDGRPAGDGAYQKATQGPAAGDGAVYVTAGSSGKLSSAPLNHPVMYISLLELGSVVLDVDEDSLDVFFIDDTSNVDDSFRVLKAAPQPTPALFSIAGTVEYDGNQEAVSDVELHLAGSSTTMQLSGAGGDYTFDNLSSTTWDVTPRKVEVDVEPLGAVSALDAVWALQATLGSRTLNALQSKACDVSGNGSVSAYDASQILRWLVGDFDRFAVADACDSDWVFAPVSGGSAAAISGGTCEPALLTFPTLSSNVTDADFRATLFGDCTLNGVSPRAAAQSFATASVKLGRAIQRRRRYIRLPIRVEGIDSFSSLDIDLRYDPKTLRLIKVRKGRGIGRAIARHGRTQDDGVRIVLAATSPITARSNAILTAVFERLKRADSRVEIVRARVDDVPARALNRARRKR